jgi:hypothetical protein
VSTSGKPDPGWRFVQKLLDDEEVERIERLSDEEIDSELRAHGRDPTRLPSAEELLAKAEARAGSTTARNAQVVPLQARKRTPWVVWMAAAILGAAVLALVAMNRAAIVAFFQGTDEIRPDDRGPPPRESTQRRAEKLRDDAEGACRQKLWGTCEQKLDDAMKLDPAGESESRVWNMRRGIEESVRRDAASDWKKTP